MNLQINQKMNICQDLQYLFFYLTSQHNSDEQLAMTARLFLNLFVSCLDFMHKIDSCTADEIYSEIIVHLETCKPSTIKKEVINDYGEYYLEKYEQFSKKFAELLDSPPTLSSKLFIKNLFLEHGFSFFAIYYGFSGDDQGQQTMLAKMKNYCVDVALPKVNLKMDSLEEKNQMSSENIDPIFSSSAIDNLFSDSKNDDPFGQFENEFLTVKNEFPTYENFSHAEKMYPKKFDFFNMGINMKQEKGEFHDGAVITE